MNRIKHIVSKIAKEDKKKLIITSIIIAVLLIKIAYPYLLDMFGSRYELEVGQSNSSYSDDGNFENDNIMDGQNLKTHIVEGDKGENSGSIGSKTGETSNITIYITGAVSQPGVVTLEADKRLDDAIKILGGLAKDADYNRINLATKLEDGQHYIIPYKGENISNNPDVANQNLGQNNGSSGSLGTNSNDGKINLNTADSSQLEEIPGVGPATAKKIIEYREKNGKFNTIEDIKNVTGIGDKKFENMKDSITV